MASPISDPWGAILIGCFISLILFGIILAQAVTYAQNCEKDPVWLKTFVAVLVMLDTIASSFAMAWAYQMYINGWGNMEVFAKANWLLAVDPMLVGMIACMVQLYFAGRLHIMVRNRWLTIFVIIFSIFTVLGGFAAGISILVVKSYAGSGHGKPAGIFWQVSTIITDITITVSVTYHLHGRKGLYAPTDRLLDSIIQLTIQNGFLTSIVAVVDMAFYIYAPVPPHPVSNPTLASHIILFFIMPKLYANTVLSSLNARPRLRHMANATVDISGAAFPQVSTFVAVRSSEPHSPEGIDLEADMRRDSQSLTGFERK
ncbi:hypothetical protein FIBSPDRAFT_1035346 [Athelia psychrophila]|uniref:DUF6534 domain-containing protein n=1 Tax=Athelia psychrophila TaxID=1759441 RepID=A0A166WZE6_9AGAM|nr:hypothetical protein FIBSPDRAFT_1035346 [Fibularhizoctonia sp. CBS 109695]